ncbi:hypothetical protein [Caulobacter phage Cr30]|uniref:endolysin n=1 Tax=Caulobacter phage Cr30 TaxID=1357714 RepID=UPI0004A9BA3F|nr:endolysin [Caulobacter phage Cr30]AGS81152.1 hypothetical protein [Caulobacter phage Cr30]
MKTCVTLFVFLLSILIPTTGITEASKINYQIDCLARVMYHEARAEPSKGIAAVGNVVINRKNSKQYGSTICEVVYSRNQFSGIHQRKYTDWKSYNRIYKIAETTYSSKHDVTFGATYFHNQKVKPRWSYRMQKTITIGNHSFYKNVR